MKKIIFLGFLFSLNLSYAMEMETNEYEINFSKSLENHNNEDPSHIHQKYDAQNYTTTAPAKNKSELFKECILKSDKLISTLEKLKEVPEQERVSILYQSNYWKNLNEEEKNRTLKILAQLTGVKDNQYVIIKGKIAEIFKEECIALVKK